MCRTGLRKEDNNDSCEAEASKVQIHISAFNDEVEGNAIDFKKICTKKKTEERGYPK